MVCRDTSPSYGQPNAVAITPTSRLFVPFATAAISSIAFMPSSVVMRTLSRLNAVAHRDTGFQVVDAGLDRALGAARVRNEGGIAHAGLALDSGGDLFGIRKLWDHLRMHEARDLDLLAARSLTACRSARSSARSGSYVRSICRPSRMPTSLISMLFLALIAVTSSPAGCGGAFRRSSCLPSGCRVHSCSTPCR